MIRRIFYDNVTGDKIQEVGRGLGMTIPGIEEDIATYKALSERNRSTFDVLELPFGAYVQDFAECIGYRVNVATEEIEFLYPDPNKPEEPTVFRKSLSEEVVTLKTQNTQQQTQIGQLLLKLAQKDVENTTLKKQNADMFLRLARLEVV